MTNAPASMRIARLLCLLVIAIMGGLAVRVITQSGMYHGAGGDTFAAGYADPWQSFINSDLVCGLLLMMGWVAFRERHQNRWATVLWLWIIFYWGNIVVAVYAWRALSGSDGNWSQALLGVDRRVTASPLPATAKGALYLFAVAIAAYIAWAIATVDAVTGIVLWGYIGGFAAFVPAALLAAHRDRL